MKFFAFVAVFAAVLSLVCAQTPTGTATPTTATSPTSPTSPTTTTYTYTTSPTYTTPTVTVTTTTAKPFKQALLSLLFNKKSG
ncbi:GL11628 [Drosophila persimilis]|uniref:GL11628 n=1 Tax=Drosophila persimilis TaxID=7234 RepID=B4GCE3_DROPE|nr:protein PRY2 [Drosophila persimilis]EDW32420.1 GL11628 [Drosophila persimilis]